MIFLTHERDDSKSWPLHLSEWLWITVIFHDTGEGLHADINLYLIGSRQLERFT